MKITIELDKYEIANLRSLIEACFYHQRNPLKVANTGDWIGQIYNKLPEVDYPPNVTPKELVDRANNYV